VYYDFPCSPWRSGIIYFLLTECLPGRQKLPKGRISKRTVDALTCPAGRDREFLWDNAIAGFGVAAFPSGKKVYVVQYRQDGRSRRSNIGEHGRLTPEQARSEAKKLLGVAESGSDPIADRKAAREVRTFGSVADDFLSLHIATKRKLLALYFTFGEYDFLSVSEAPNEEVMASALIAGAASGEISHLRTSVAMTSKDAMKAFK
jgi:uncharacterized protein with GYD domain